MGRVVLTLALMVCVVVGLSPWLWFIRPANPPSVVGPLSIRGLVILLILWLWLLIVLGMWLPAGIRSYSLVALVLSALLGVVVLWTVGVRRALRQRHDG